jgi:hypothetical protein
MHSDLDYSAEESASCSDSGSDRCIRDHADESADPLQGNSPDIYCIYIFLYCLPYIMLQLILRLFSSSFILLLNDIFTNICVHGIYINFVWHRKSYDVFFCLTYHKSEQVAQPYRITHTATVLSTFQAADHNSDATFSVLSFSGPPSKYSLNVLCFILLNHRIHLQLL